MMNDGNYKSPCTMMTISTTTRDKNALTKWEAKFFGISGAVEPGMLRIGFEYHRHSYRETMNTKAYTIGTLVAQVGGFIGT